jgi:hypothetical protein
MDSAQQTMPPDGFLQNVTVDFPCFQKFELRVEGNGRKFCVYELSWYPNPVKLFDQLWSFHFVEEEAKAELTRKECERDGTPLPPGRYVMTYFNGRTHEGLAESSAKIHASKKKKEFAEQGYIPEVVVDKYNPRKFAVQGVLVVS